MKPFLILLILLPLQAFSLNDRWSTTYKTVLKDFTFSTFWGGLRRGLHWHNNRGAIVDLKLPDFQANLPVYIQADDKKKDLWIFYPGTFGLPDGRITPSFIDHLEKRDVHVAVVPNMIAKTYLKARPSKNVGLEDEKRNQEVILKEVLRRVGTHNIKNVNIIAESLGVFQILTTLASSDIVYDSLTFLWPPLHLDRALLRFDELIENKKTQLEQCSLWYKWPLYVYEVKGKDVPDLSSENKSCLGAWVIGGFVDGIKETAGTQLKVGPIPETFSGFIKTVFPELSPLVERKDERLSMIFLLGKLKSKENIRIVSSIDDFLNKPEEWDELKKNHPEVKDIFLFPWGGHSGPLGIDELVPEIISGPKS